MEKRMPCDDVTYGEREREGERECVLTRWSSERDGYTSGRDSISTFHVAVGATWLLT
jgi:hypothetical protein